MSVPVTAPGSVFSRDNAGPETTSTIVIGSGFSGLAVAAELHRQGVSAIVVDSFRPLTPSGPAPTTGGISLEAISERAQILRLLEHYAHRNALDIRPTNCPVDLSRGDGATAAPAWTLQTVQGTLTAQNVVFTRGALTHVRRILQGMGVTRAKELSAAMASVGLYLVGVGEHLVPTTAEILHQAKRAGAAICARTSLTGTAPLAA